jgi:prevent-host-death family protein
MTIKEAKAHLNQLVEAAMRGEDVVLMRGSKHVAAIVPLTEADLFVASHLSDEQAARLWKTLAAERAAGKTLEVDSMEGAVAALSKERRPAASKGRSARRPPARARRSTI